MAAITKFIGTVTNQKHSQADGGQSVYVFLNGTDSAQLKNVQIGQSVSISGATGVVDFVDTLGHSFRVKPTHLHVPFKSSATPGYLSANEIVTLS